MSATHTPRPRRTRRAPVVAATLAAAVGLTTLAALSLTQGTVSTTQAHPTPKNLPAGVLTAGAGPAAVDVTSSYGCPGCADTLTTAAAALTQADTNGQATIRIHLTGHGQAPAAASAAVACMSDIGTGQAVSYYLQLMTEPPQDDHARLLDIALRQGVNSPTFAACVTHGTYVPWARALPAAAATSITVNGKATPAAQLRTVLHRQER